MASRSVWVRVRALDTRAAGSRVSMSDPASPELGACWRPLRKVLPLPRGPKRPLPCLGHWGWVFGEGREATILSICWFLAAYLPLSSSPWLFLYLGVILTLHLCVFLPLTLSPSLSPNLNFFLRCLPLLLSLPLSLPPSLYLSIFLAFCVSSVFLSLSPFLSAVSCTLTRPVLSGGLC